MSWKAAISVLALCAGSCALAQNGNGNGPNKTPPDRMFFDTFLPGPLNAPWTAQRITPDTDLTVTRVFVTLKTPGRHSPTHKGAVLVKGPAKFGQSG